MKKLGSIVHLTILDHVSTIGGTTPPAIANVYGLLIKEDKTSYYVASWVTEDLDETNTDSHTVLKSAVVNFRYVKTGA